ncbi:MAG: glucuronate isomerase [Spirochaetaceae bacterium]
MKPFMDDNFLLLSRTAERLYHEHAATMPIFDYHCHLSPRMIAEDHRFSDIGEAWLAGDHYKWRAMRTNGVPEAYVTGDAPNREKFQKWAETVPYTVGNPLYHWTHLELKKPFGIEGILLNGESAEEIWERTNALLKKPEFSVRGLLREAKVRYVGTTDDPADDLSHHRAIAEDGSFDITVSPSFRPDNSYAVDKPAEYPAYLGKLAAASGRDRIGSFRELLTVLMERIDYFAGHGCKVSDHALTLPVYREVGGEELERIFRDAAAGREVSGEDHAAFATALLKELGREYARRGWVFQLHIGALRNNNSRMYEALGPDTGFDSMADGAIALPLSKLLDSMEKSGELPRTIIYNLNPRDNELLATMIGNFQDGSVPGKMQLGSGWWFNDQKAGMEWQMRALANMGLLRRFVGMLTDSRSFLSFPRHEYFRRTLCNMLGSWVEEGEAPNDMQLLGSMVEEICWHNAVEYFGIDPGMG